jgi:hypothetical protein
MLRAAVDGLHGAAAAAADANAVGEVARLQLDLLWAEHGRLHERLAATGALLARARSRMPIPATASTAGPPGRHSDGHGDHGDDANRGVSVGGRVASGGAGDRGESCSVTCDGADNASDGDGSGKTVCKSSTAVLGRAVGSGSTSRTAALDHDLDRLPQAGSAQAEDRPVIDVFSAARSARTDNEDGDGDGDGSISESVQVCPGAQAWYTQRCCTHSPHFPAQTWLSWHGRSPWCRPPRLRLARRHAPLPLCGRGHWLGRSIRPSRLIRAV